MSIFTIGTDYEYPLYDVLKSRYVSVIGRIGGSKDEPVPTPFGNVQEDNVLAEVAIKPANTEDEFVDLVLGSKNHLFALLAPLTCVQLPFVEYPEDELENEKAQEFGCEPDFNAYTGMVNPKPLLIHVGAFRSAGAHIHVGHPIIAESFKRRCTFIQYMDKYHGLPSVLLDNSKEALARKKIYGAAGAFRPKEYGAEYRTASNYWVANEQLIRFTYAQTEKAVQEFLANPDRYVGPPCQKVINTGDQAAAEHYIKEYSIC